MDVYQLYVARDKMTNNIVAVDVLLVSSDDSNNKDQLARLPTSTRASSTSSSSSSSSNQVPTPKMSNTMQTSSERRPFAARYTKSAPSATAEPRQQQHCINSPSLQQNRLDGTVVAVAPASIVSATHLVPTPQLSSFGNSSSDGNNNHHDIGNDEEEWHESFHNEQQQETTCFNDDDDNNDVINLEDSSLDNNDSIQDNDDTDGEEKDEDWNPKNKSSGSMRQWVMYVLMIFSMSSLFLSPEKFKALVDMDVLDMPHPHVKFLSLTTRTLFSAVLGGEETLTAMKMRGANSSNSSINDILPLGNSSVITPIFLVDKGLLKQMPSASKNNTL